MGRQVSPFKIAPSHGDMDSYLNTWFIEPTRAHNPNGISMGTAVFCRAHYCDRPTDIEAPLYVYWLNKHGLRGRGLMTSSALKDSSLNYLTGNWVNKLHVTPIWL